AYQNVLNAQYNINGHAGYVPNSDSNDERIGSFISLPAAAPLRMLPNFQQQQQECSSSQLLFQDGNNIVSDTFGNENLVYGQAASQWRAATPDLATGAGTTSNDEEFCQNARPYTSMLPLDYKDYYSDYGCHSDNLSTYSDTPPVTMSSVQHKLQQKRKISLMMAMTTASVIASGETRVAVQQKQQKPINNYPLDKLNSQIGYCSTADDFSIGVSALKGPEIVNEPTYTTASPTTNRKLPKRLPSPQYKTLLNTSTVTVATDSSSPFSPPEFTDALSLPQSDTKYYRPKQLPKLPISKTNITAGNANSVSLNSFIADHRSTDHHNVIVFPSEISSKISTPNEVNPDRGISSPASTPKTRFLITSTADCAEEENIYQYIQNSIKDQHELPNQTVRTFDNLSEDSPSLQILDSIKILNNKEDPDKHTLVLTSTSPRETSIELDSRSPSLGLPIIEHQIINSIEKISEPQASSVSSFNISEYLKPYTLDSIKYHTEHKNDHTPIVTATTISPHVSSHISDRVDLFSSSKFSLPPLESLTPFTISKWSGSLSNIPETSLSTPPTTTVDISISTPQQSPTASKSEMLITPLSDSSSTLSYLLCKQPIVSEDLDSLNDNDRISTNISSKKVATPFLNNFDSMFTTSVFESDLVPTEIVTSTSIIDGSPDSKQSYVDYMRKFDLPELPPILDICIDNSSNQTAVFESSIPFIDTKIKSNFPSVISTTSNTVATSSDELQIKSNELVYLNIVQENIEASSLAISTNSCQGLISELGDESYNHHSLTCASGFDDSFYDSFNVDLSATIAQIESETCITPVQLQSNTKELLTNQIDTESIYILAEDELKKIAELKENADFNTPQHPFIVMDEPHSSPSKVADRYTTSVLGGLSKGIKGGLDGVLCGVNSTMDSTKQHTFDNNSKKSFSFTLASKLVPSVSGLLSNSNRQTDDEEVTSTTTTLNTSMSIADNSFDVLNAKQTTYKPPSPPKMGNLDGSLLNRNNNGSTTLGIPNSIKSNQGFNIDCIDKYNYSSDDFIDTDNLKMPVLNNEFSNSGISTNQTTNITDNMDNNYVQKNDSFKTAITMNISIGLNDVIALNQNQDTVTVTKTEDNRNFVSTKTTNVNNKKSGSGISSGGGVFGSIFGKAAAAVQSATQAVNHSASSVASAVAQKTSNTLVTNKPIPVEDSSTVAYPNNTTSTITSISNTTSILIDSSGYHDYNKMLIREDASIHQYSTTSDDYRNSNTSGVVEFDMPIPVSMSMPVIARSDNIYYSDEGNHSQQNSVATPGQKMLPTVPSAGSTGKKLPTINGKSGLLIKQQPTEIFDDESEDEDVIKDFTISNRQSQMSHKPSYCIIDSEQDDYYLDSQLTTPSSRRANDYYEHVSTSYDYREDFFNEEDEYKYLEHQRLQQQEQFHQLQQNTNHKQSSLDYIDNHLQDNDENDNDDFVDENYPSDEECGNYLDESSSGSVGGIIDVQNYIHTSNHHPMTTTIASISVAEPTSVGIHTIRPVTTIPSQLSTAPHHQIIKQDSIIIEEGDSLLMNLVDDQRVAPHNSQEVNDQIDMDGDDKLGDLVPTRTKSQKKKILTRGETEEVVSGQMQILRKSEITAKQRWHWAYNKIIIQLNVSTSL
ncbi:hypothetical protein KR044_003208, partial [Drosophila immigrans]